MLRVNDPTDADLVARALDGDRTAIDALVARYDRAAFHVALGLLGDREEALDVVQSSFLKMMQSLDTLSRPDRFGSWFLRIVRNRALDASSRRRRRRTSSLESDRCSSAAGPLETLQTAEAIEQLREAMRALNDDQRAVIAMRYGQDLDYATISKRLGIPASTVRSRLYEARLILKARFGRGKRPPAARPRPHQEPPP
jgi:RNA polymerase sigma-70 factor (ECF subfamily)